MSLTTLPLSTLQIYQPISTQPLTYQIRHLESLAHLASTHFDVRHVWHESRDNTISLIRIKALFSFPSYILPLITTLSAIQSSLLASHGISPTLHSVAASFKPNWMRLFVTSIFVYAILFVFSSLPIFLNALTGSRILILVFVSSLEVYLITVLSINLVVSVAEERFGETGKEENEKMKEDFRVQNDFRVHE